MKKMKFRGEKRVRAFLKGSPWLVFPSFKMLLRDLEGVANRDWFIEKGYSLKDITFVEGDVSYSIEEYEKKTGLNLKDLILKK